MPKIQLGKLSTERGMRVFFSFCSSSEYWHFFISYWQRKFLFRVKRSENPEVVVSIKNLLGIGKEQIGVFLQLMIFWQAEIWK